MFIFSIMLASFGLYLKLEAIGLYRHRQFPEIALGGFLWLVVFSYAVAVQTGSNSLPNPAQVFDFFEPLAKVILSGQSVSSGI